jgi:hypothetical protein
MPWSFSCNNWIIPRKMSFMIADLRPENWTRGLAIMKHWIVITGTCMTVCARGHVGKISSSMHQSLASQAGSSQAVNYYPHMKEHEVSLPYSQSWARSLQSTPCHPDSFKYILILSPIYAYVANEYLYTPTIRNVLRINLQHLSPSALPHDLFINRNQQPAGRSVNKQLRCAGLTRNPDGNCLGFYNHKQQCKGQRGN